MIEFDSMARSRRRLVLLAKRHWPAGQRAVTSTSVDRYLVALLIAAMALAVRGAFTTWAPVGYAVVPQVFAVALAAYALGFGPSMLTLVVSGLGLKFLFMGPRLTLFVPGVENRVVLALTWMGSIGVAMLFERMRILMHDLRGQRELLRRLLDVQEREKQHLCNEFHDGLVQYAVGARMLLEGQRTDPHAAIDPPVVDTVIDYLKRGIEDGRRAIRGIRPAILDDCDLSEAIADLVDHFCTGGMEVSCTCDASIGRLPKDLQTAVYRVVQEALNNVRKHSGTQVARVSLTRVAGDLRVEVADDGSGFDPRQVRRRGFGLRGITERVQLAGGTCAVESQPGEGTRVGIRVPLPGVAGRQPPPVLPVSETSSQRPAEAIGILANPG